MTTEAGIKAAYATEINNCEFRDDAGVRFRSRPQSFCDAVSMSTTLSVAGAATFALPITVAQAVVVNGISYSPGILTVAGAGVSILTAGGAAITVPEVPPGPGPNPYVLPPATASVLGGVIVGSGLSVTSNGTLSASTYSLPAATTATLGGIVVGTGLTVESDGTLNANPGSITPATNSQLGGVIVGTGLGVTSNGTISNSNPTPYTLPTSTTSVLGGVIIGNGLTVATDGTLTNANPDIYFLPPATASTLGGVIAGSGVNVAVDGTISVPSPSPATTSTLGTIIVGDRLSITGAGELSADAYTLPAATASILGGIKVGSGLSVTVDGTLSANAGNVGTVTEVDAGTGLQTSPAGGITGSGTIGLTNTGVTAGSYSIATVEVDAQGRVVNISSGGSSAVTFKGSTLVSGTAPSAVAGDFYINTAQATAAVSWTGIATQQVQANQFVFYTAANQWEIGGITDVSTFVTLATTQTISGAKTFTVPQTFDDVSCVDLAISGNVTGTFDDGTF